MHSGLYYDRILSGDKYRPELLDSLPSHARTAYEVAAEGTVLLLRNDGILPLDASGRSILLTGRWLDRLPVAAAQPESKATTR